MRWPLLLVLFSLACSEPAEEPPTLPGNEAPPCELGPERYFLIDRVSIPVGGEFAYDLSMPTRRVGSYTVPYFWLQWSTTALAPAIDRAFANHHILWVLVTSSCSTMNHHRVGLRRGISFSDPMIELEPDVMSKTKFVKANPDRRHANPCVYVGSTALPAEERFQRQR